MIKTVLMLFVVLIVGLILLHSFILPQITAALGWPTLASWTGLEAFLKFLPFALVGALVIAFLYGIIKSGKGD